MTKTIVLALAALMIGIPSQAADGAPNKAKARAELYQAEVRAMLTKHQWHVAAEGPGILVLDHLLVGAEPSAYVPEGPTGYTRAVIRFKPKTDADTDCSASVLNYKHGYYLAADVEKYHGHVPTPTSLEVTQSIQSYINEARKKMLGEHSEYSTPTRH